MPDSKIIELEKQDILIKQTLLSMQKEVQELKSSVEKRFDHLDEKMDNIGANISAVYSEFSKKLKNEYVTTKEFTPVKAIAFGMVGTIMLGFLGAVLALVFR